MARITYRKTRKGETITMRADKGEDLRGVVEQMAKPVQPTLIELERAYLKAHREEQKAVAALPENPPKAMTDRCWALAEATNKAREALTYARDKETK